MWSAIPSFSRALYDNPEQAAFEQDVENATMDAELTKERGTVPFSRQGQFDNGWKVTVSPEK